MAISAEAFEELLRDGRPDQVVEAMLGLGDAERKKLSGTVKAVRRAMGNADGKIRRGMEQDEAIDLEWRWRHDHPNAERNIELGIFGCCAASDVYRIFPNYEDQERVVRIMLDRNPGWLATWVDKCINSEFPDLSFDDVQRFYKAGLIDKPQSAGYTLIFERWFGGSGYHRDKIHLPLADALRAEPELLEDEIWRLFETETTAFSRIYADENYAARYESFGSALYKLSDAGEIDRGRLLDASLSAMTLDFKQTHLADYGKFHESMSPTLEEMQARQPAYRELLASPYGRIQTFAMKHLAALHKAGRLDGAAFLAAARSLVNNKAKGNPVRALKMARELASDDAALIEAQRELALAAMAHPVAEVQSMALDLIEGSLDSAGEDFTDRYAKQSAHLSPQLAGRARQLAASEPAPEQDASAPDVELGALPDSLRSLLRLGESDLAGGLPPALHHGIMEIPSLADPAPLPKLNSTIEMLELAAQLIEKVDHADQVETLLDGIARLGHQRDERFERLAAPLVKRMETCGDAARHGLGNAWGGVPGTFGNLLRMWLANALETTGGHDVQGGPPPNIFLMARAAELTKILAASEPLELLSTPSYSGGWIEAEAFVARAMRLEAAGRLPPGDIDLMQGLLRLSPAGRAPALEAAAKIGGYCGRLIRFALGGDERPTRRDADSAHLWVCAARARDPVGDVSESLSALGKAVPALPDLLQPAHYAWQPERIEEEFGDEHMRVPVAALLPSRGKPPRGFKALSQPSGKPANVDWDRWPCAVFHQRVTRRRLGGYILGPPWRVELLASIWPLNPEPYFAYALQPLEMRIDDNGSYDTHAVIHALFDDNRAWGEMAILVLAHAMVSKSADTHGLAIDALIAGIESGRADVDALASVFSRLPPGEIVKLNRLAEVLRQVSQVSDLHRWWVGSLASRLAAVYEPKTKGIHFLYEIAVECLAPLGASLPAGTEATLSAIKGNSKSAKLARELRSLEGPPIDQPSPTVVSQALAGRLALANRFRA